MGGLYLGDIISIVKPEYVQNLDISAILSCLAEQSKSKINDRLSR